MGGGWVQNREFFLGKKEREARNDSGSSFMTIQLVQSGWTKIVITHIWYFYIATWCKMVLQNDTPKCKPQPHQLGMNKYSLMMKKLPSSMMHYYYWCVLSDPTHAGFFPQNRGSDRVQINKSLLLFINILINSGSLCSKNIYQLLLKKMGGRKTWTNEE
jgi:hypothetical protein